MFQLNGIYCTTYLCMHWCGSWELELGTLDGPFWQKTLFVITLWAAFGGNKRRKYPHKLAADWNDMLPIKIISQRCSQGIDSPAKDERNIYLLVTVIRTTLIIWWPALKIKKPFLSFLYSFCRVEIQITDIVFNNSQSHKYTRITARANVLIHCLQTESQQMNVIHFPR